MSYPNTRSNSRTTTTSITTTPTYKEVMSFLVSLIGVVFGVCALVADRAQYNDNSVCGNLYYLVLFTSLSHFMLLIYHNFKESNNRKIILFWVLAITGYVISACWTFTTHIMFTSNQDCFNTYSTKYPVLFTYYRILTVVYIGPAIGFFIGYFTS